MERIDNQTPLTTIRHNQYWKSHSSHYLMESNGKAMIRITHENDIFELSDLYVEEDCRNKGIATSLINDAIGFCKKQSQHGLIMVYINDNSSFFVKDWYKRIGFEEVYNNYLYIIKF